jgi:hypothetical protein
MVGESRLEREWESLPVTVPLYFPRSITVTCYAFVATLRDVTRYNMNDDCCSQPSAVNIARIVNHYSRQQSL